MWPSKKSAMGCGPSTLPPSPLRASTSVIVNSTRLPCPRRGAPPASLAPRLALENTQEDDHKHRSTVTHVAGLICYRCPRLFSDGPPEGGHYVQKKSALAQAGRKAGRSQEADELLPAALGLRRGASPRLDVLLHEVLAEVVVDHV